MSNWHWCCKNEQHLNIEQSFDHQMSQVRVNVGIQTIVYIFKCAVKVKVQLKPIQSIMFLSYKIPYSAFYKNQYNQIQ